MQACVGEGFVLTGDRWHIWFHGKFSSNPFILDPKRCSDSTRACYLPGKQFTHMGSSRVELRNIPDPLYYHRVDHWNTSRSRAFAAIRAQVAIARPQRVHASNRDMSSKTRAMTQLSERRGETDVQLLKPLYNHHDPQRVSCPFPAHPRANPRVHFVQFNLWVRSSNEKRQTRETETRCVGLALSHK